MRKIVIVLLLTALTFTVFLSLGVISFATSEETPTFQITDGCFDEYTNSDYYYDATTQTEDTSRRIQDYPDYFSSRYYLNHDGVEDKVEVNADEWILGFIPIEVL